MSIGENQPVFRLETIEQLFVLNFKRKSNRKIDPQALKLLRDVIRTFVNEAILRSVEQAKLSNDKNVTTEHLEKVLPQLLLDF